MLTATSLEPKRNNEEPATPIYPHVPGEEGTWVFILGEMVVFAVLFASFMQYRAGERALFVESQRALNQSFGAVNTVLLLISSLLVVLAVRAVGLSPPFAPGLIAGAFGCGFIFLVVKVAEYAEKVRDGIGPSRNTFFMFYFVLTGLHAFHLVLGLGVLSAMFVSSRRPVLAGRRLAFFEGGACFWHMVDLLWIVLFPLLYLVR